MSGLQRVGSSTITRLLAEISHHESQITALEGDISEIQARIEQNEHSLSGPSHEVERSHRKLPNESQRDFLIRTGKITPFSKLTGEAATKTEINLGDALYNAEAEPEEEDSRDVAIQEEGPRSHRILLQPGFVDDDISPQSSPPSEDPLRPLKRRRTGSGRASHTLQEELQGRLWSDSEESNQVSNQESLGVNRDDSEASSDGDYLMQTPGLSKQRRGREQPLPKNGAEIEKFGGLDDGNEKVYQARLESWSQRRRAARRRVQARHQPASVLTVDNGAEENEVHSPHPTVADAVLNEGFRVPGDIYPSLFDYQKTGVQWLWELYSQQVGGIVGDEMGLGKTIQVISFLAGLHYSRKVTKPIIIVAPATVMKQWVNEFHTWWPPFRVSILHSSGSGMIDIGREAQREEELSSRRASSKQSGAATRGQRAAKKIVDRVVNEGHVLVTTYSGLQTYAELLVPVVWEYAVLDEGHKIRNPNAGKLCVLRL